MAERFVDWVYDSMMGNLLAEERLPDVEDAFADGAPCELWYSEVIEAYQRVCDRLGVSDEENVEAILCAFMNISKELCYRMYEYGARFGRKE